MVAFLLPDGLRGQSECTPAHRLALAQALPYARLVTSAGGIETFMATLARILAAVAGKRRVAEEG